MDRKILDAMIREKLNQKPFVLLAIDGPCGGGKSTLAKELKENFQAQLLHMDDYYLPFQEREENWKKIPCANMDFLRLKREVLEPLSEGLITQTGVYQAHLDQIVKSISLKPEGLIILEGSYSLYPALQPFYDLSIFLNCPKDLQIKRLKERNPDRFEMFQSLWVPLEDAYFKQYKIEEAADFVLD